jgi:hypothetical protein
MDREGALRTEINRPMRRPRAGDREIALHQSKKSFIIRAIESFT